MFQLTFETDNAAFEDNLEYEIARILEEAKKRVVSGYTKRTILDINGNVVGSWELI